MYIRMMSWIVVMVAVAVLLPGTTFASHEVEASEAFSARYDQLARVYVGHSRALNADAARYAALGHYYTGVSIRGLTADSARYAALGAHYDGNGRALNAAAARYAALGRHNTAAARGIDAGAARYTALGHAYGAVDADSARYAALGRYYTGLGPSR